MVWVGRTDQARMPIPGNGSDHHTMHIQLNGEAYELPEALSVADLLQRLDLTGRRLAVEVNREIVPRSQHATNMLADGDQVEIVHAIGGG